MLSRAFRSRFLELHVGDLPDNELEFILQQRCALAPSYSKKLVGVMRDLYRTRQVWQRPVHCKPDPWHGSKLKSKPPTLHARSSLKAPLDCMLIPEMSTGWRPSVLCRALVALARSM